jgi:DNA-binding NarL/FixJ family response regulator
MPRNSIATGLVDRRILEAGDGSAAIAAAQSLKPNVVVLDLSTRHMSGLEAAEILHASLPSTAIVTLTRHRDSAYVQQLLAAGASAYVLKQSSSTDLLNAIRAAANGQRYLDSALNAESPAMSRRSPATPTVTERERRCSA